MSNKNKPSKIQYVLFVIPFIAILLLLGVAPFFFPYYFIQFFYVGSLYQVVIVLWLYIVVFSVFYIATTEIMTHSSKSEFVRRIYFVYGIIVGGVASNITVILYTRIPLNYNIITQSTTIPKISDTLVSIAVPLLAVWYYNRRYGHVEYQTPIARDWLARWDWLVVRVSPYWNKGVYAVAIILLLTAIWVAPPPFPDGMFLPSATPFSATLNFQVSESQPIAIPTTSTNRTITVQAPNVTYTLYIAVRLIARGAIAVGNPMTMLVDVSVPQAYAQSTNLTEVFWYPDSALALPLRDDANGNPAFAIMNLTRGPTNELPNGAIDQLWQGTQSVKYTQSGSLGGMIDLVSSIKGFGVIPIPLEASSFISIESVDSLTSQNSDALTASLTFAILFVAILELRRRQKGDNSEKREHYRRVLQESF